MIWTVAPQAREDMFEIWNYTDARWGEVQANRYVDQIEQVIVAVASGTRAKSRDKVRKGYVEARSGSHLIYMKPDGYGWLVVRVLHKRMDIERHLA